MYHTGWSFILTTKPRSRKLNEVIDKTPHAVDPLPIYSVWEMEDRYAAFVQDIKKHSFGLGGLSKTLGQIVDQIFPGEVVMIIGDTSQGKTAVMQAIAKSAAPLPTLFCELELPLEVMFQRGLQMETGCFQSDVIRGYTDEPKGRYADTFKGMHHIWTCPKSGIGMDKIREYIIKSELKIGERPKVVFIDYMGLVRASKDFWVKGRTRPWPTTHRKPRTWPRRLTPSCSWGHRSAGLQGPRSM